MLRWLHKTQYASGNPEALVVGIEVGGLLC